MSLFFLRNLIVSPNIYIKKFADIQAPLCNLAQHDKANVGFTQ